MWTDAHASCRISSWVSWVSWVSWGESGKSVAVLAPRWETHCRVRAL